jgi:hypothetical protein
MGRPRKSISKEEAAEIRNNPPYLLNTHHVSALVGQSVRTVREWFQDSDFPLKQGHRANSEKYVLRDDLFAWMDRQGREYR